MLIIRSVADEISRESRWFGDTVNPAPAPIRLMPVTPYDFPK